MYMLPSEGGGGVECKILNNQQTGSIGDEEIVLYLVRRY